MTTKQQMEFPRINFVALLAGALFLVSIFLYWWGLDTTGFVNDSVRWPLWSGPPTTSVTSSQTFQTLVTYGPVIGVLTIASAILVLLGAIPKAHRLLMGGGIVSVLTPILYALLVNYTVSNGCGGSSNCITGPFGTETTTFGPLSLTRTWGFQTGFYIEIVGAVLAIIAMAFHQTFLKIKAPQSGH